MYKLSRIVHSIIMRERCNMKRQLHVIVTSATVLLLIVTLYALYKVFPVITLIFRLIFSILLPFLIALLISYILNPFIKLLERWNIHRVIAIAIIYLLFFATLLFFFYVNFPKVIAQLEEMNEQIPQLLSMYEQFIIQLHDSTSFLPEIAHEKLTDLIVQFETNITMQIEQMLEKLANMDQLIVIVSLIPVIVFYMLKDIRTLREKFTYYVPQTYAEKIRTFARILDESLGGYLRGQLIVAAIVATMTYVVYFLIGLPYTLVFALFMGLMNIIPYFGPIIGMTPALFVAVTFSWKLAMFIIVATLCIQIIESSFLSPYIMGKSVRLHPLWIIFALFAGGKIAGFLGLLLAVPTMTILRALYEDLYIQKQRSN